MTNQVPSPLADTAFLDGGSRVGYGAGLVAAAQTNKNIVGVCADLTSSLKMDGFEHQFPDRMIQVGVAEQNLIGVAAGLALAGKIPFAASYAVFSPGRSWDQIRVSVCYSNLNVKIVGGHTGLSVGPDGATHQALEDLALTLVLPNMTVVVPADAFQAYQATLALAATTGPAYLRLSREKNADITSQATRFELGKAQVLKKGKDLTIFSCGLLVGTSLQAASALEKEGLSVQVINLHTLKPLDTKAVVNAAHATGAVVTVEEHQLHGGLFGLIAETLAQTAPIPIEAVAVHDTFGESGQSQELLAKYHLASQDIQKAAWKVVTRKQKRHV